MELERIISAARGERPVDRLLVNARIVNVFTAEIAPGAVAIAGDRIVGLGQYPAREVVDLGGRYLAPGLIDAHVHIESAMAGVSGFTRAVLPRGTTTVVADPHEMANVLGTRGIDYMLASSAGQPMNYYFSLPSCVPASELETSGARLEAGDLEPYFDHPQIVALAEMMNYPGVIHAAAAVLDKIRAARRRGKPVDGHAPGLTARDLQAYLAAGVASDHECTTAAEAREKLASGMRIMVREGTGAKNLIDLLPALTPRNSRRTMWCSDDRHLRDLLETGHIDHMIRQAIAGGVDPLTAIQMATLNPAEYFGLHHLGAIAPGRQADLVVFNDLHDPRIEEVYVGGRRVALHGALEAGTVLPPPPAQPAAMRAPAVVDWSVPAGGGALRVIRIVPGQILTRQTQMSATISGGLTLADPQRDLLKLAVVERHTGSGRVGKGFVSGLGLRRGALASSVAHDAHNVVVAGTSDEEMQAAYAAVVAMGGGLAVACDDQIRARLPLPIAGLMTDAPAETVLAGQEALNRAAHELGATPPDPFMTLSFLALPVIPELKLTDRGLVDVSRFDFVPLFCG